VYDTAMYRGAGHAALWYLYCSWGYTARRGGPPRESVTLRGVCAPTRTQPPYAVSHPADVRQAHGGEKLTYRTYRIRHFLTRLPRYRRLQPGAPHSSFGTSWINAAIVREEVKKEAAAAVLRQS
jgi:hypothetical protein